MEIDVLIVDDEPGWVELLSEDVEAAEATWLSASSLDQAIEALEQRRFNAALIDMALMGEHTNRDGEKVLRVIDGLSEGTAFAVVSGHTGPKLANKIALMFDAPLIPKSDPAIDDLQSIVAQLVARGRANRPRPANAQQVLRGGLSGIDWEIMVSNAAPHARGGVGFMNRFIAEAIARFTPVTEAIDGRTIAQLATGILGGSFWSRRHGQAISLLVGSASQISSLSGSESFLAEIGADKGEILSQRERGQMMSAVHPCNLPRTAFRSVAWIPDDEDSADWLESLLGE